MKCKERRNNKGLTLVEVIISLGILAILVSGAYMIFGFGTNTFSRGTEQYDIQSNTRLAGDYITKQVRYATDVKIVDLSDIPAVASLQPYQNYIYFDSSNNCITHINKYFKNKIKLGEGGSIEFKSSDPYKELNFIISAEGKKQKYNIEDKLVPMNINLGNKKIIDSSAAAVDSIKSGQAIFFITASEYLADQLRPYVEIGSTNSEKTVEVLFNRKIERTEVVEYQNVTNPNITNGSYAMSGMGAGYAKITTTETNTGASIVFRIIFTVDSAYGPISDFFYDYTATYDNDSGTWSIK